MMKTPNIIFHIDGVQHESKLINEYLQKKYADKRKFYSCNQEYNFVSYVQNGSNAKLDYVNYSGNNEKSRGNFNQNGLMTREEQKELKDILRETKSPIWYGYISFEKEFWQKYCNNFDTAFNLMKKEFPRFLKQAKFNTENIEWYAGFHENTEHRHIHFSFYEKKPTRKKQKQKGYSYSKPYINMYAITKAKLDMEETLTNSREKISILRNEIIESFKQDTAKLQNERMFKRRVLKVLSSMPKRGRVSYASENMKDLIDDIDSLSNIVISLDQNTTNAFNKYLKEIHLHDLSIYENLRPYKEHIDKYLLAEKYKEDLYRRLGNVVIDALIKARDKNILLDVQAKSRLAKKRIKRKVLENSISYSFYLAEKVKREAVNCFEEHLAKLEEMKFKILKEQGLV